MCIGFSILFTVVGFTVALSHCVIELCREVLHTRFSVFFCNNWYSGFSNLVCNVIEPVGAVGWYDNG